MKVARTLAACVVAGGLAATVLSGPAQAGTGAASAGGRDAAAAGEAIRYAWVDECPKKGSTVPCGAWTLNLRSGRKVVLGDAVVFPREPGGGVDRENSAPLAVSGDGSRLVYFRKSDGRLVWNRAAGGKARALPGGAGRVPKGIGMGDVNPTLSHDGTVLVIDYTDEAGKLPTLAVDLTAGDVERLPGGDAVQGLSPDGRQVLTSRFTEDNTTAFSVYGIDGSTGESREVPQVVSNNAPVALADDGVTVGVVIFSTSGKPRLRQYDLSTDAVSPAVEMGLAGNELPYHLMWTRSGALTLWSLRLDAAGDFSHAVARGVNPSTGGLKKADSFRLRAGVWAWWLPGE
ncbi:hypothetical protein [Sphaerisporangium sp. TRM90804]|uniref:hypothetical protein n=1 Tax=Sphaerisporangium sp. TRM90804 TaxID=3031113 RepID=UPI00244B6AFF|nr:hypothetical protein [Sphaerisporangium sp. TRM90804]MDH2428970.1 hypothetical protein [Sphaerisporangium sp. TRM90804]